MRYAVFALTVAITALQALTFSPEALAQRNRNDVVVAPVGDDEAEASRIQLEDQLRRFSDRFVTRVALATNQIRDDAETNSERLSMLQWKSISLSTMVELAIGQNVVTNLLDMMVITSLSRLVLEDHWLPQIVGVEAGQPLLEAYLVLEQDIWSIADQVLTEQQQDSLRDLITQWHRENAEQIYPWYIRLDEFSGQRAADLNAVKQSGGLLGIRATRESIDEIQAFGERIMFYMQRAPLLTSFALEESIARILQGQEVTSILDDTERFSVAAEELVAVVSQLPNDQFAAIDQFMQRLSEQRTLLVSDLEGSGPQAEAVLSELRLSLEALERIVNLTDAGSDSSEASPGLDIAGYRELIVGAADTARELRLALIASEELLSSAAWADRENQANVAIEQVVSLQKSVIDRLAYAAAGVIAFFFLALLAYRIVATRLARKASTT